MTSYLVAAGEGPHLKDILNAAMDGLQGLPQLIRAVVMLLNSRNMTAAEPRPVSEKLNKARAKSGKQPLLDYTHIRIKLSRAMAARAGEAADSRSPTRLHLVRGSISRLCRAPASQPSRPLPSGEVVKSKMMRCQTCDAFTYRK